MSIKSDRWIRRMSNRESVAVIDQNNEVVEFRYRELPVATEAELAKGYRRAPRRDPSICLIEPFIEKQIREIDNGEGTMIKAISKGVTSFGYDVTLSDVDLKLFSNVHATMGGKTAVINPKKIDLDMFVSPEILSCPEFGRYVQMPPHSYMLGYTVEVFNIPRNILVACLGKSTYARAGIVINVTPIEPEFEGQVVIEIFNGTSLPAMIFVNEGIAQFLFLESDENCEVSYKDRGGKYQGQRGLTHARV